ncbi:MAG: hypothetical protein K6G88_10680 [Lachnospiraceae bacterium]|nr:hypothetical protein [Lachnospiraceae bacterium]
MANSCNTVIGECYSAGRLYDKIGDTVMGRVVYKMDRVVVYIMRNNHIFH